MAAYRRWNTNGEMEVIYDDGRLEVWNQSTGELIREAPANPRLAAAMRAGDTNTMDDTIAYGTKWLASPMGQDYLDVRRRTADEDLRRWGKQFGLSEQNAGTNRYQAETGRYSAETSRMDTEARIKDLERRYGLDASRLGLDFNKQSIEYAKTPRSWLDALDWERGGNQAGVPVYLQNLAQNITNPAFGAKGAGTPQMNSLGDTVAAASGNAAAADMDPTKAVTAIIKASPPSNTPGLSSRDAATIQLATELYKKGAGSLSEGSLEAMDQDEVGTLQGVFDRISPGGGDRFIRDYQRTRIPTRTRAYATA